MAQWVTNASVSIAIPCEARRELAEKLKKLISEKYFFDGSSFITYKQYKRKRYSVVQLFHQAFYYFKKNQLKVQKHLLLSKRQKKTIILTEVSTPPEASPQRHWIAVSEALVLEFVQIASSAADLLREASEDLNLKVLSNESNLEN